jgi:hypothetical protein
MTRNRFLAAALLAVGTLSWSSASRADDAAAPAAEPAKAAPAAGVPAAEAPKTAAPTTTDAAATKTPTPVHAMMAWVAKQVAPNLECGCPATVEGEKAWRSWFAGDANVPLASLRDSMVAQGWTADRTITFFKEMAAKQGKGDCSKGDCAKATGTAAAADAKSAAKDGCCQDKPAGRTDGKPCCGGCKGKKEEAKTDAPKTDVPADKPVEAPKP